MNIQYYIILGFFAWFLPFSATGQTCNYLAYESFTYNNTTPLQGQTGGSGWQSGWEVQNNNNTVPGYQTISSSLSYLDLQTMGNKGSGGYQYITAGRRLNTSPNGLFQPWLASGDVIGAPGTTLWTSVLLKKNEANNEEVAVFWHESNITWCSNCSSNMVAAGYFGTNSNTGPDRFWTLRIHGNYYKTAVPVVAGESVFIVLKLEFEANSSTVSIYVNPATLGNTTPAPTLVQSTSTPIHFRSVALYAGNDPGSGEVDEIRAAASYPCVAPDPTIAINLPPVADFTLSPSTGTAPLQVSLNASASMDPDGSIASYSWNFGDGTATGSGVTTNHTFNATGILDITLTVTDNLGLQHNITKQVTVLNQYGTFTCQLGLFSEQLATCTSPTGRFRITNYNNIPLTLRNSSNAVVPPASGNSNLYSNLAAGNYILTAAGANGCKDTFQLTVAVDSSTCAGWSPESCQMKVGVGLEGLAYYSSTRMFKDYFKNTSEWLTFDPNGGTWNSGDVQYMPIDSNGYPAVVPFSTPNGTRHARGVISANGFIPTGVPMRFLYDGTGALSISGAITINGTGTNYIDFTSNAPGNIWFDINSSQATDHVRNIRVVEISDLGTYLTQPFRQNFLDRCAVFTSLRMMDLMQTNGNNNIQWANRTKPTYFTQSVTPNGGMAYEYVIQLANILNKDIWVCVPHQADSNYIAQMAQLFKNQLNPGIKVWLEYSNEVWNWIFSQAHWVTNNGPSNISYPRKYVERAQYTFNIWHNVWGSQKTRVKRVLGTQAGYDWITEEILSHADQDLYDYISPSWYAGLDHSNTGNPDLTALGAAATAEDVLENANNAWLSFYEHYRMVYRTAKLLGKKVVNYEGGQHFTNFTVPAYIQAMYDAQTHPDMYALYDRMLDSLRVLGSEMPMAFILCGPLQSIYGSWGHLNDIDDPAPWTDLPKYQVLLDHISTCPPTPQLRAKVLLEGPFNTNNSLMNDHLRTAGLIPLTSPYGDGSTLNPSVLTTTGNNAIVDWIKVELRDKNNANTLQYAFSGLLQRDGDIVAPDGISPLQMRNADHDQYYVVIIHRNHLGIRTASAVAFDETMEYLDFTTNSIPLEGGVADQKSIGTLYALYAGDTDGNKTIETTDHDASWNNRNMAGYQFTDCNLDGTTNATDRSMIWNNRNTTNNF